MGIAAHSQPAFPELDDALEIADNAYSMKLTAENYAKGFLIDEELLAGVAADADSPGRFLAFVLQHTTGEQVGAHHYESLEQALDAVNRIPRSWAFEKSGGCGGGNCGADGSCGAGSCGGCKTGACPMSS